jgi:lysophospholipase L1-like esterase
VITTAFRSLLFWGLFMLLIPQALWVRRTARRFPPAAGQRTGQTGNGRSLSLLAIGDSIIDGVGVGMLDEALVGQTVNRLAERLEARIDWQALGKSGLNSRQVRERLIPRAAAAPVDFILVSVGVNDIIGLSSLRRWRRNIRGLVGELRKLSPNAQIAMAGIPPLEWFPALPQPLRAVLGLRGHDFHRVLREEVAAFDGVQVVEPAFDDPVANFAEDGFHPSASGYSICADAVVEVLISNPSNS